MARGAASALCLAFLLAVFDLGTCLRCYQCNTQGDPGCSDPFTPGNRRLVDCSTPEAAAYNRNALGSLLNEIALVPGSQFRCHKLVMQTGTIVRTCLDVNLANPDQTCELLKNSGRRSGPSPNNMIKDCKFCNSDGCNGAGSIVASLPLAALTAFVSYLIYKQ